MNFFITLVIFRFDPTYRMSIECAFVEGVVPTLPRIKLNNIKDPDPKQIVSNLLHRCLVIDPSWVNPKIVELTRFYERKTETNQMCQDAGITCVYKINVPNTVVASESIKWIQYDKLEEMVDNQTTRKIVRTSYHTY